MNTHFFLPPYKINGAFLLYKKLYRSLKNNAHLANIRCLRGKSLVWEGTNSEWGIFRGRNEEFFEWRIWRKRLEFFGKARFGLHLGELANKFWRQCPNSSIVIRKIRHSSLPCSIIRCKYVHIHERLYPIAFIDSIHPAHFFPSSCYWPSRHSGGHSHFAVGRRIG